jgi:hypothetical protein
MANEEQANEARRRHGHDLIKRGVHALGVEEGRSYGKKGWVVVAHVAPKAKLDLPRKLSFASTQGTVDVPVVPLRSAPFKLE